MSMGCARILWNVEDTGLGDDVFSYSGPGDFDSASKLQLDPEAGARKKNIRQLVVMRLQLHLVRLTYSGSPC